MKSTLKTLYKQVEVQNENMSEVCWIPEYLAEEGKIIYIKEFNSNFRIKTAYNTIANLEEIETNRNHPLREATDI